MIELLAGEKQERETKKAMQACNDYLRMGAGRSLEKLSRIYSDPMPDKPPTRHIATLKIWSAKFGWVARSNIYDAEIERQKNEYIEARRFDSLKTGLALDYERVLKLKHLADTLEREIWQDDGEFVTDNIWVPDVKQIGGGEYAERVDIVRFNQPILTEFRAILDDLAKETGGRKSQHNLSGEIAIAEMSLDEWKKRQQTQSEQAQAALEDFDDE